MRVEETKIDVTVKMEIKWFSTITFPTIIYCSLSTQRIGRGYVTSSYTIAESSIFCQKNDHLTHGLRTPDKEIAFTAHPQIKSQSQIFRYGLSIFRLPHRPKISDLFDLSLHWVSVVHDLTHAHWNYIILRSSVLKGPVVQGVQIFWMVFYLCQVWEVRKVLKAKEVWKVQ